MSIDAEKVLDIIEQRLIILKSSQKLGIEGNCLNLKKSIFFL